MSKTIQEQAQTINRLEEKLERLQNSPFIWKISNFASVMEAAKTYESRVIVSDPFYSVHNGYKFSVELYPDGYYTDDNANENGEFMSIYLRILVGEYDGLLIWPFQDSVVFTLLDQNELVQKRRHLRKELQQPPEGLVRPTEASEPACGVWEFVFHKNLYSRSYIKDDTILSRSLLWNIGKESFREFSMVTMTSKIQKCFLYLRLRKTESDRLITQELFFLSFFLRCQFLRVRFSVSLLLRQKLHHDAY